MKRIVVLIDGTWGKEDTGLDTNVAKLDSGKKIVTQAFITARATNGTVQLWRPVRRDANQRSVSRSGAPAGHENRLSASQPP
jgi:hypothetical protein